MTELNLNRGKSFLDFESYRNQEWIRRRKLRIEQVRNQSKNIARVLRQKVGNEEQLWTQEFENNELEKFKCWRAKKLNEMEFKLRCALEEFGLGHKLAVIEPCSEKILKTKNKINELKAQERGKIAKAEKDKNLKMEEKKKNITVQRKKMTRKMEDLRSALIRSISSKNQLLLQKSISTDLNEVESVIENSKKQVTLLKKKKKTNMNEDSNNQTKVKKVIAKKKRIRSSNKKEMNVNNNQNFLPKEKTLWINLNDVQSSTNQDTSTRSKNSQTELRCHNVPHDSNNSGVEFYNYHTRYLCKTPREFPHLIEKIDVENEPKAKEVMKNERKIEKLEAEKRQKAAALCQERGNKALKKEGIKQDYNNLIIKLEDLDKKQKLFKIQHQMSNALLHMNDHRLSETAKIKQQIMNSKFESIYYGATFKESEEKHLEKHECEKLCNQPTNNNFANPDITTSTMLSFSPSNLKNNSPVSLKNRNDDIPNDSSKQIIMYSRYKNKKVKNKLLTDIDKTLKESRKLRETIRHRENSSGETTHNCNINNDKKKSVVSLSTSTLNTSPHKNEELIRNEELQNEERNNLTNGKNFVDQETYGPELRNYSLPVSTATSYKSPPSVINSSYLSQFVYCLENPKGKIDKQLNSRSFEDLFNLFSKALPYNQDFACASCKIHSNSTLQYYISKLLNMSRENVANLSVSSDNNSLSNAGDSNTINNLQNLNLENLSICSCQSLADAEVKKIVPSIKKKGLTESSNNGEISDKFLEENLNQNNNYLSYSSYFKDCETASKEKSETEALKSEENSKTRSDRTPLTVKPNSKLENITQKCTQRIDELSNLLKKVRQDKQLLLQKTQLGAFDSDLNFIDKTPQTYTRDKVSNCTTKTLLEGSNKRPPLGITKPYCLKKTADVDSSEVHLIDSQIVRNTDIADLSTETFPDVMSILLKKKIITSPFKWCEKSAEPQFKSLNDHSKIPKSIETAIFDFRKKISEIKPVSLNSSDSICAILNKVKDKYNYFTSSEGYLSDLQSKNYSRRHPGEVFRGLSNDSPKESVDCVLNNARLSGAKFQKKIQFTDSSLNETS